jgi:soluble cytochrome b562
MSDERMQAVIQELRDAAAVMDDIEKRLPQIGKFKTESWAEIDDYRRRTDKNLAEINDKLKRLIEGRRPD